MQREVPLIKEYRINDILKKCLVCFDDYMFDRIRQRECVLKLYETTLAKDLKHWDKSIFRGMVIPSLKYLGLIYGEGDSLKVSANGKIIVESENLDKSLHERVLRAIVYELDKSVFGFIEGMSSTTLLSKADFINTKSKEIKGSSDKQKKERINKWLLILNEIDLIKLDRFIHLKQLNKDQAKKDIISDKEQLEFFVDSFFSAYKELAKDNIGIVKIEEIRKKVCVALLKRGKIVTEHKFDELLREIPFESEKYLFSMGKPMGAQEKLFKYKNAYYNTLHIKFYP